MFANLNVTRGVSGESKVFEVLQEQNYDGIGLYSLMQWQMILWSAELYGKILQKESAADSQPLDYET